MHITHALGHLLSGRRGIAATTLVVASCITLALAIGGSAPANAAGPNALAPDESVTYPTWAWGPTKVCATNSRSQPGMVDVRPWSSSMHDEIYVRAYSSKCIDRWWFASPIDVINISDAALGTYPVLTVRTS